MSTCSCLVADFSDDDEFLLSSNSKTDAQSGVFHDKLRRVHIILVIKICTCSIHNICGL